MRGRMRLSWHAELFWNFQASNAEISSVRPRTLEIQNFSTKSNGNHLVLVAGNWVWKFLLDPKSILDVTPRLWYDIQVMARGLVLLSCIQKTNPERRID